MPGTTQAREAGFKDDIAEARRYLDSIIGPATDGRREAYLTTGPELVDYLARNSEVKFSLYAKHPDYLSNRPGTTLAGRALAPLPFDGRLLGADFALLRPPIGEFMALGGMMIGRDDIEPLARPFASVANFRRALSLLWRHATDRLRHRRGTRLLMGNALAARLFYSLRQRKVPVWLNASLRELTTRMAASPARCFRSMARRAASPRGAPSCWRPAGSAAASSGSTNMSARRSSTPSPSRARGATA